MDVELELSQCGPILRLDYVILWSSNADRSPVIVWVRFSERCKQTMSAKAHPPAAQILRFCRQYLQLEPSPQFPDDHLLREDATQVYLYGKLFAPDALTYAPPPRYQLRILKELVSRIEGSIDDWEQYVSVPEFSCCYLRCKVGSWRLTGDTHTHTHPLSMRSIFVIRIS